MRHFIRSLLVLGPLALALAMPAPAGLTGAVTLDTDTVPPCWHRAARSCSMCKSSTAARRCLGGPWLLSRPHRQIPGSLWLPNIGIGEPDPATLSWFQKHLERLTGGDRTRGLLFYCQSDCRRSWNAAKQALLAGYSRVLWCPTGIDGWLEAGLSTEDAAPLPGPQPSP